MNGHAISCRRAGFTLIELLVVIAIIALLVAILLPVLSEARKTGRLTVCQSNLRQFGVGGLNYASDFNERLFTFSWRNGVPYRETGYSTLWPPAGNDNLAAANQAVDIFQRRGDRWDISQITGWIPHVLYSHLVLNDYLQQRLPEKMVACPEDRLLLLWQSDPQQGFYQLGPTERPTPLGTDNSQKRWPYSSSYAMVPPHYSPDQRIRNQPTVQQATYHYLYSVPGPETRLGNRRITDVVHPAQKVMMFNRYARHFGRSPSFYGYPDTRAPLLFYDGSVQVRNTVKCNRGWWPNDPNNPGWMPITYQPQQWEPPVRQPAQSLSGRYQWTRAGLRGIDFDGSEVKGIRQ